MGQRGKKKKREAFLSKIKKSQKRHIKTLAKNGKV